MATSKQKEAARRNIGKARQAQSARAHGKDVPRRGEGMTVRSCSALAASISAGAETTATPLIIKGYL